MDAKALLQDLHFQLSIADSNLSTTSEFKKAGHLDVALIQFVQEDRVKMTEKWVAKVRQNNRSRCLSFNSYFEEDSVCNKLKKCFLKSFVVNEEDLENLRLRLAELKIEDPSMINEDNQYTLRLGLAELETIDTNAQDQSGQGCLMGPENGSKDIKDHHPPISLSSRYRRPGHCRSITVPLPKEVNLQVHLGVAKDSMQPIVPQCDPTHNVVIVESVNTKEKIFVDENFNLIGEIKSATNPATSPKSSITDEKIEIPCFRHETLYPSPEELLGRKQGPTMFSPNKIVGCYENEEDYLQTQFYLLREDFIRPLKASIEQYRKQFRGGKIPEEVRDLKLYHNARIIEPRVADGKLGIAIDVGFPLPEKIGDKDFMDGSLVLISSNHLKDVQVGTVLSRKFIASNFLADSGHPGMGHKRRSNILVVQLHGNSHFDPALRHRKILLAESQAFFQPYYYVMKILQGMTCDDLPLKEYILGSTNTVVKAPSYLVEETKYLLEDDHQVEVEKSSSWPRAETLNVNDSQLRAFKKALTEKLVLIQGPPGTGKTYLGCKVAKALLQNRQAWNKDRNQPLLLMCQSNHALDQFMELLLPVTKNIIRIGNQSKSGILAPFTLRRYLKKSRSNVSKHSDTENQKMEVKKLAASLKSCSLEYVRLMCHGIVAIDTLISMGIVDLQHACCFESSENYLMWLEEAKHCETSHLSSIGQICKAVSENFKNYCPMHTSMSCYEHLQVTSDVLEDKNFCLGTVPIESFCIKYALSLSDLKTTLAGQLSNNEPKETNIEIGGNVKADIEERLQFYQQHLVVKNRDANGCTYVTGQCLWTVPPCMRWPLYRSWVKKLERMMQLYLEMLEIELLSASTNVEKLIQREKLLAMRQAELIGMTTSAAARLYPLLCELQCPIALVEEAAEVHESHIVATVTKHCQHLILLGDHKQLRPRPACYSLSQTHFTDVSLFERLVLNNTVKVNTLLTQHRMQPHISALIRPSIYAELHDHECTRNRKNIIGVKKNVFFFTHNWQENKNLLTGSYCNPLEARMAVQLLRYLMLEGYGASEICILTAYREQVKEIEKESCLYPELNDVRVLTVDNFQGEESRIIILSLVRNNSANQIGFLKIENRVCVALSRARDGFFMLGNINLLSSNSELWQSVHKVLQANASVGWFFPLRCPRHPRRHKAASQPDDLLLYIQQGGCQQTCLFKLSCGHFCRRNCHEDDAQHIKYRCEELCKNKCILGHPCQKRCSKECGDCDSIVWKQLACGHWAMVKCSLELEKYLCEVPVRKSMDPCLHSITLQCWMPALSGKYCPHQCPFLLKCGHQCPLRCNSLRHPNHSEIKCWCDDQSFKIISYR